MISRKRRLEIVLQKLRPPPTRSAELEQYSTPAPIAADILWEAFNAGDIVGRKVLDLGCGNGVFAIGAKLMGSAETAGVDIDEKSVEVARENAESLSLDIDLRVSDVREVTGSFDTVLQNPPFGSQTKHADRPFIEKALEVAPRVYSLHNSGTEGFVDDLVRSLGGYCMPVKSYKLEIPYAFEFHRKAVETIPVVLLRFDRTGDSAV
jgi:putative methylase